MNTEVNAQALLKLLNERELPQFNSITEVGEYVTAFIVKKYDLASASHINYGYCFIWAYLVWALWKQPLDFVSTNGHVVIHDKKTGMYYDATSCEGYDSLDLLEVNKDDAANFNVVKMSWYWARCGTYKAEFRRILRFTHNKLYRLISKGGLNKHDPEDLYVDDIDRLIFSE